MITNHHIRDHSNGKPQNIVFVLHGYGADGANLVDLSGYFAEVIPSALFVFPDAPFAYEYSPEEGRQWFSLMNRDEEVLLAGAKTAHSLFTTFAQKILDEFTLTWQNVTFIGFSQGAMMSLYIALQLKQVAKAVVCFSGTMVSAQDTISSCNSKPPVCIVHGNKDDVVPCGLGKFTAKTLQSQGITTEFHEIEGLAHSINLEGINFAKEFLKGRY